MGQLIAKWVGALLSDALVVGGAGSITYGAWLIYEPAGYITGGLIAGCVGILWASRRSTE